MVVKPMPVEHAVYYRESDGKPMAESDLHQDETIELKLMLRAHFAERDDLDPPLQGYALQSAGYVAIAPSTTGRSASKVLGLELDLDAHGLIRLFDARSGRRLLRSREERGVRMAAQREAAAARAAVEHEAAARVAADAEVHRLREENERLRGEGSARDA